MIDDQLVQDALKAPDGYVDTPEQAQLRACLTTILSGHDAVDTIKICFDIITLMRDQLMTDTAAVRRHAARVARDSMSPAALALASGQTKATISRLLTESRLT